LRTGAGKPIETTSKFHPLTVSLNFATIFFVAFAVRKQKRADRARHEQLNARTANIDDKNFSLHARPPFFGGSVIAAG
jgi:hypothetical protein